MKNCAVAKRADGVAVITFDTPSSPVNVISREWVADLRDAFARVSSDRDVRGCVLISGKKDGFIAGADLDGIAQVTEASQIEELSRDLHRVFDEIENCRFPVVAAIHGAALGGGLETAIACHARVATSDPKTVLAFPEVMLGLLPGAGGTQRAPRLLGLRQALPLLLTGRNVRAKEALKIGLVDELVSPETLLEAAVKRALNPGRNRSLSLVDRMLSLPPLRAAFVHLARRSVLRKTRGNYPAPLAILNCIGKGAATESRLFAQLVMSPEAKNLVWIFQATRELKKEAQAEAKPTKKLAVLGAGLMGQGIASVSLPLSEVVLKDISSETLKKAKDGIEAGLEKRVRSGSISSARRDEQKARLITTTELEPLKESELVIEAVFENLPLKQKLLSEIESIVGPKAVIASNTSALPIAAIAGALKNPERVLGMHYFSPVPKMPLLEIIVTPQTSPSALAVAQSYGAAQGKTVIVVKDGPGFYTTRILMPLLNEAMLLLEEGATVEAIDRAMKDFGFPVGPIALLDEVGIDVGAHVAKDLGKAFAHRLPQTSTLLTRLHEAGYAGRKNGKGFYRYPKKDVNTAIYDFAAAPRKKFDRDEIVDRIALMMVNEAVHCLREGVIRCERDGDIGAIMGLGFPPFRGGPFRYIESRGRASVARRMSELADRHGSRFTAAQRP